MDLLQSIARSQIAIRVRLQQISRVQWMDLQQYIELIVAKAINKAFSETFLSIRYILRDM